jgi:hypothetical protein
VDLVSRFTPALHLATALFGCAITDQALAALLVQSRAPALPQRAALLGHRVACGLSRFACAACGRATAALHGPALASPRISCFSRRAGRRHYIKDSD